MFEEYERKKRKQIATARSLKDYVMGFIILLIGLFFLFRSKMGTMSFNDTLGEPDMLERIFGGLSVVYGSWRIYRGYQKKYFN